MISKPETTKPKQKKYIKNISSLMKMINNNLISIMII